MSYIIRNRSSRVSHHCTPSTVNSSKARKDHPMKSIMPIIVFGLFLSSSGCASVGVAGTIPDGEPMGGYYEALAIPPGHLPPPGECRIWYPGVPPGQQPPPGHCDDLEWRVPPGAWLVYGPSEQYENFIVTVYDERRPRVVISIRYYDAESGRFLREERVRSRDWSGDRYKY